MSFDDLLAVDAAHSLMKIQRGPLAVTFSELRDGDRVDSWEQHTNDDWHHYVGHVTRVIPSTRSIKLQISDGETREVSSREFSHDMVTINGHRRRKYSVTSAY